MTYYSTPQPSIIYSSALYGVARGEIDWVNGEIKVMLCSQHYTPDGGHWHVSDVAYEIEAPGYTPGGEVVTGRTIRFTADGRVMIWDANDVRWPPMSAWPKRAVMYQDTGDPETSRLISCIFLDHGPQVIQSTYTITWPFDGAVQLPNPDWPPMRQVVETKTWPYFQQTKKWIRRK